MKTITLDEALRAHVQAAIHRAPTRHSERTASCPPLPQIPRLATAQWTPEEGRHLAICKAYCQRMIAIQWRISAPTAAVLWRFAAGELPELQESMRLYFEEYPVAKALMASVASTVKAAGTGIDRLRSWFGSVAIAFGEPGDVATAGAFADEQQPLYYRSWKSPDEHLHCALEETEEGALQLRIDNPSGNYGGRTVRVQLIFPDTERLDTDVIMRDLGSDGAIGTKPIGTFAELAPRLGSGFGVLVFPVQRTLYETLVSAVSSALEAFAAHRRAFLEPVSSGWDEARSAAFLVPPTEQASNVAATANALGNWRRWLNSVPPSDLTLQSWRPVSVGSILSSPSVDDTIDLVITSPNEMVSFNVPSGPVRVNVAVESWSTPKDPPLIAVISADDVRRSVFATATADPDDPVYTATVTAIPSGLYFAALAPGGTK